ncbi:MAG: tyrosine-protein phosphatase [Bacteroidales bacterium]
MFKKKAPEKLFFSTDVHAHFLPGIDDGSKNIETSVRLLEGLMKLGIENFVATPHITHEVFPNNRETISAAYNGLLAELNKRGMTPNIRFSAEYRIDETFDKHRNRGELIPFPNNYLLIENSFVQPYMGIRELIFDLQLKGFKPILAHPERYAYYHKDKYQYDGIHDQGCLFQVNLLSFSGCYGKEIKEAAYWLLKKGYVDFVGTDTHHQTHLDLMNKFMQTKDYRKLASKVNLLNDTLF